MDNEDYVSYEIAKKLKEHGFDWPCNAYYTKEDAPDGEVWLAPTMAQAQKWLREVKQIVVLVDYDFIDEDTLVYSYDIYQYIPEGFGRRKDGCDFWKITHSLHVFDTYWGDYDTYESALSAGLECALKLIDKEVE